ncbi:phosphodiesterase [Klebsiella pneumoniae]|uniref:Phosphodiesterase n=1 Tax=Klebsiella pneumoniae TaxID=573 RepID=A0A2X3C114_KLEPN|nr:phosphodiesterase [Klebsiella pneumoniae]
MVFARRPAASPPSPSTSCGIISCPSTGRQLSPDQPLDEFVRYAERQIVPILPDSPPRFVNLNQYLWSERWLERYREMDFIQRVLNGMASRRPRLEALRDSWQDLDTHYDRLETQFWRFYPQMMRLAENKQL